LGRSATAKRKNRILHVSDRFTVHHQESSTVYTTIGICHTGFVECLLAGSGSRQQAVSKMKIIPPSLINHINLSYQTLERVRLHS
jgi:hypothetical protein